MNAKKIDEAYAVLGLRPGACPQEIAQARNDLSALWDPSMHTAGSKGYQQCMRMLEMTNAAYELLIAGANEMPATSALESAPAAAPALRAADFPDQLFAKAKQMEAESLADAIEAYKRLAQVGHVKAQFRLGYLFFSSPAKDLGQAAYWWKRAADEGHVDAQFNLGLMYERGCGMPLDAQQAQYWFCQAARRGDIQAKNKLRKSSQSGAFGKATPSNAQAAISASEAQALLPWAQGNQTAGQTPLDSMASKDFVARKHKVS